MANNKPRGEYTSSNLNITSQINEYISQGTIDSWKKLEQLCTTHGFDANIYQEYFMDFKKEKEELEEDISPPSTFSITPQNNIQTQSTSTIYPLDSICRDLENAKHKVISQISDGLTRAYFSKDILANFTNTELYAIMYAYPILKSTLGLNEDLNRALTTEYKQDVNSSFNTLIKYLDHVSYASETTNIRPLLKQIQEENLTPSNYTVAPGDQQKRIRNIPLEEKNKFIENILMGENENNLLTTEQKTKVYWLKTYEKPKQILDVLAPIILEVWTTHDSTKKPYQQ